MAISHKNGRVAARTFVGSDNKLQISEPKYDERGLIKGADTKDNVGQLIDTMVRDLLMKGMITESAIKNSEYAMNLNSVLNNKSVVNALTSDGSKITDWMKMKTPSIKLPNGQKVQIHYYKNQVTGKVNYTHADFKIKGVVNEFYPARTAQDVLDDLNIKFKL